MRYAIQRPDGGVTVLTVLPAEIEFAHGVRLKVVRCYGNAVVCAGDKPVALPVGVGFSDLEPDSVPGVTLHFPSVAEIVAKWPPEEQARHNGAAYHLCKPTDIPVDRTFRDAWTHDGKAFGHDMPKCRDIHRGRMRVARTPLLVALDVEHMRADERGDTAAKKSIAARKQALRDVTDDPAIDAAATPEALKAVWPECLKG